MKKFTTIKCAEITELMQPVLESFSLEVPGLSKKHKKQMEEDKFVEGLKMMLNNPNYLFENLEKKHYGLTMLLLMKLHGSNDLSSLNPNDCSPTMIKLLDLMCEIGLMERSL